MMSSSISFGPLSKEDDGADFWSHGMTTRNEAAVGRNDSEASARGGITVNICQRRTYIQQITYL